MAIAKVILNNEVLMDVTQKTADAGNMLYGTTALKNDGTDVTGNVAGKNSSDLTASGATVTAPAGFYEQDASKTIASGSATAPASISGSSASVSTGTNTLTLTKTVSVTPSVTAGYVSSGTAGNSNVSLTASVTTKAAATITPSETAQEIAGGTYLTGKQTIGAISSTYVGSGVARKSSSDLTANGATVSVPAGYYASAASKSIASGSATTPATSITANPTISVNSSGLITASVNTSKSVTPTVSAGYVGSGTAGTVSVSGSNTQQLTTKTATTITPTTTDQTIASGTYLTGTQTIKGDVNLVAENIKEGVTIFGVEGTHAGGPSYKVTGTKTSSYSGGYVRYPGSTGTKYNGDFEFEFTPGESLYISTVHTMTNRENIITINGETVASGEYQATYTYTLPEGNVNIIFSTSGDSSYATIITESPYNLQEKTVTPSDQTQVIEPDSGTTSLIDIASATMTHYSASPKYWHFSILWAETPIEGETYHVYFYWNRPGYASYTYDGDIVWNGYGTTFSAPSSYYGYPASTMTLNETEAISSEAFGNDDNDTQTGVVLKITKELDYIGLSKVTVLPIPGGGGSVSSVKSGVQFIDYDGTLLHSYSTADALALSALPANPSHTGLTAQGWNWSLANIKSYLTKYPDAIVNVGQMYVTDDGKTRIYIHLGDERHAPMLGVIVNGTVDVDWGDGTTHDTLTGSSVTTVYWTPTHNYATGGDYVIKLTVTGTMGLYGSSSANLYSGLLRYSSIADTRNRYYNCAINKVEIGSNVTSIGNYAFSNCFSLTTLTIPDRVTSIGSSAFNSCYGVAEYHMLPTTPPTLSANAFTYIAADCIIYVPQGCLEAYQTATNWSTYASYMQEEPA